MTLSEKLICLQNIFPPLQFHHVKTGGKNALSLVPTQCDMQVTPAENKYSITIWIIADIPGVVYIV